MTEPTHYIISAEGLEAVCDEMSTLMFHGGFMTRREFMAHAKPFDPEGMKTALKRLAKSHWHDQSCPRSSPQTDEYKCDCGLDAALKAAKSA